jgi:hypothetical protein
MISINQILTIVALISVLTLPSAYGKGGDGDPEMQFGQSYEGYLVPQKEHDCWNLYVAQSGTVQIIMEVEPGIQGEILLFDPNYPNSFPNEAHAPMGNPVTLTTYISEPGWCDITVEYLNYDLEVIDDPNSKYRYTISPYFNP